MKRKLINRADLSAFFRAMGMTLVCIGCAFIIYMGCCSSYEAIREVCFDDRRSAVTLNEEYFKFFDLVYYFAEE